MGRNAWVGLTDADTELLSVCVALVVLLPGGEVGTVWWAQSGGGRAVCAGMLCRATIVSIILHSNTPYTVTSESVSNIPQSPGQHALPSCCAYQVQAPNDAQPTVFAYLPKGLSA